jgi:hypothetical protein
MKNTSFYILEVLLLEASKYLLIEYILLLIIAVLIIVSNNW